jgi:hypothetical protein
MHASWERTEYRTLSMMACCLIMLVGSPQQSTVSFALRRLIISFLTWSVQVSTAVPRHYICISFSINNCTKTLYLYQFQYQQLYQDIIFVSVSVSTAVPRHYIWISFSINSCTKTLYLYQFQYQQLYTTVSAIVFMAFNRTATDRTLLTPL